MDEKGDGGWRRLWQVYPSNPPLIDQTELKVEKRGRNLRALEPAGAYSTLKKTWVFDMVADDAKDR